MGTHGFSDSCPNCDGSTSSFHDTKPIGTIFHECYGCGWFCYPEYGQWDLEELNSKRQEHNESWELDETEEDFLPPLESLPTLTTHLVKEMTA